jgi:phosphomannomutase/phosphoglucomutase
MINPNIFRSYDIRGIYPREINEESVKKIVQAFVILYPEAQKFVLARDSRLSSPYLAEEIRKVLISFGKEVYDLNIAPDSLYFFTILHYKMDAGIMITASHNPKEYNGMSFYIYPDKNQQTGEDIIKKKLEEIKKIASSEKLEEKVKLVSISKPQGKVIQFDPSEDYIDYVIQKVKIKRPLKIVIDSGNGACGFLPEKLFKKLGFHVKTLFGEFDGNFPNHLPDPYLEENLKDIKEAVVEENADLGFAFDADGDRVAVIDNRGRTVSGDDCLYFLALNALEKKKGPIVHDMRVSKAFLDEMEKQGVKTYFSVSHHSAVIRKILEVNAVFGGEITLHFLFPLDYYLCDDAIFSALKIAEVASQKDNFTDFIDSIPHYVASPEIFIDVPDTEKVELIERLQDYLREKNYSFIDIDGARINFKNGWALARYSNTSPMIKVRFEGKTEKDLEEIKEKSRQIFKEVGIPVNF